MFRAMKINCYVSCFTKYFHSANKLIHFHLFLKKAKSGKHKRKQYTFNQIFKILNFCLTNPKVNLFDPLNLEKENAKFFKKSRSTYLLNIILLKINTIFT